MLNHCEPERVSRVASIRGKGYRRPFASRHLAFGSRRKIGSTHLSCVRERSAPPKGWLTAPPLLPPACRPAAYELPLGVEVVRGGLTGGQGAHLLCG